jgi:hypothetical protein
VFAGEGRNSIDGRSVDTRPKEKQLDPSNLPAAGMHSTYELQNTRKNGVTKKIADLIEFTIENGSIVPIRKEGDAFGGGVGMGLGPTIPKNPKKGKKKGDQNSVSNKSKIQINHPIFRAHAKIESKIKRHVNADRKSKVDKFKEIDGHSSDEENENIDYLTSNDERNAGGRLSEDEEEEEKIEIHDHNQMDPPLTFNNLEARSRPNDQSRGEARKGNDLNREDSLEASRHGNKDLGNKSGNLLNGILNGQDEARSKHSSKQSESRKLSAQQGGNFGANTRAEDKSGNNLTDLPNFAGGASKRPSSREGMLQREPTFGKGKDLGSNEVTDDRLFQYTATNDRLPHLSGPSLQNSIRNNQRGETGPEGGALNFFQEDQRQETAQKYSGQKQQSDINYSKEGKRNHGAEVNAYEIANKLLGSKIINHLSHHQSKVEQISSESFKNDSSQKAVYKDQYRIYLLRSSLKKLSGSEFASDLKPQTSDTKPKAVRSGDDFYGRMDTRDKRYIELLREEELENDRRREYLEASHTNSRPKVYPSKKKETKYYRFEDNERHPDEHSSSFSSLNANEEMKSTRFLKRLLQTGVRAAAT